MLHVRSGHFNVVNIVGLCLNDRYRLTVFKLLGHLSEVEGLDEMKQSRVDLLVTIIESDRTYISTLRD